MVFNIAKMKEDFDFTYTSGDFEKQYDVLRTYKDLNSLLYGVSMRGETEILAYVINKIPENQKKNTWKLLYISLSVWGV